MIDEDRSTWTLGQLADEVIEACAVPMGCRGTIIAALGDAKEQGHAAGAEYAVALREALVAMLDAYENGATGTFRQGLAEQARAALNRGEAGAVRKSETPEGGVGTQTPGPGSIPGAIHPDEQLTRSRSDGYRGDCPTSGLGGHHHTYRGRCTYCGEVPDYARTMGEQR
jgi:hypothetical protein